MLGAVFLTVLGDTEIELRIVFLGPLADGTSVKRLVGARFAFEFAAANPSCSPVPKLRINVGPEEKKVIQERDEESSLGSKGAHDE